MPLASERLLIVDDNEYNRDMLTRRLRKHGFTVDEAEDGETALRMVEESEYDAVLLDVVMPGISGFEVLKTIRETQGLAELPVIITTVRDSSGDMVEGLNLGANDYVYKPINFAVLLARLNTHLVLSRLYRENERLMEAKGEFLRIASHDIKTPLGQIMVLAEMVSDQVAVDEPLPEKHHNNILDIRRAGATIHRLVTDFLDFQAIEDGQLRLERTDQNLRELVARVCDEHRSLAEQHGVEIVYECEVELPLVSMDENRIAQVAQNMLGNAIKFSPEGARIVIATRRDGDGLLFEVSDHGPGLSDEDMDKVFARYARLSTARLAGETSSGLGLAICRLLVEAHEGEVGVRNNSDAGATFWFRLPLQSSDEGAKRVS